MARLCFLTERLLRGWGVDHVVHRLADGLGRLGHEVDVICVRTDRSYGAGAYRVRILEVPLLPIETLEARVLERPGLILQRPYDLFVSTMYPFHGVAARLGLPFVYLEFGVVDPVGQPPGLARLLVRLRREGQRHQRRARRIAAISRHLVRAQVHPSRQADADVVHLGADSYGPAAAEADVAALRARLGLGERAEVVGYLGRLERGTYKGVDDLVTIFDGVRVRRPNARLLLVGLAGEEAGRHFAALPDVVVCPDVPASEIPTYLGAMDVVASASRWEGFNLPLAEAQYHGRPVVAYAIGAHPEVVAPGGGLVTTPADFADALATLLGSPAAREERGAAAATFAARFTWASTVREFATCLERAGLARAA